jgi:hypothetical protein
MEFLLSIDFPRRAQKYFHQILDVISVANVEQPKQDFFQQRIESFQKPAPQSISAKMATRGFAEDRQ